MNDLKNASNILVPNTFADDAKLFYSHHNINIIFATVNEELNRTGQWLKANKLSLSIKETKYTFFFIKTQFKMIYP